MDVKYLSVTPAYGRDYKSKAAAIADWNAGNDFIAHTPDGQGYVNKNDLPESVEQVNIRYRYRNQTQIAVVRIK